MAAEAEPHESVSPAPASFVLINIAPLSLINKDIFVSLKIENDAAGETWRYGTLRLDAQPDGRR